MTRLSQGALGPIEEQALALLAARRRVGMAEYGVGLEDCGKTEEQLLDDAIEEAADQLLYLLALRCLIAQRRRKEPAP